MSFQPGDDPFLGQTGIPIEISGERWIAQTVFWARAVGGVSLLAGGAVLLPADWNVSGLPPEIWLALVWGAPSIVYFGLSWFIGKFRGAVCRVIALFAIAHAIAIIIGAVLVGDRDIWPLYLLLGGALVAGLTNLVVSAFWARRAILQGVFSVDGQRGYEVLAPTQPQSISSDLEK
jgi:hypothetical protein